MRQRSEHTAPAIRLDQPFCRRVFGYLRAAVLDGDLVGLPDLLTSPEGNYLDFDATLCYK